MNAAETGWLAVRRGWRDMLGLKAQPFDEYSAVLWSVEQAAFRAHERWFNGHRVYLERGQLVTSHAAMAAAFGWTLKKVRGFEERAKRAGIWAVFRAPHWTVITVCNYDEISPSLAEQGQSDGQSSGISRAPSGQTREQGNPKQDQQGDSPEGESQRAADQLPLDGAALDAAKPSSPCDEAIGLWNEYAGQLGWKSVVKLTAGRRTKLKARLRELGGLSGWRAALEKARASELLGDGSPPPWWGFDFLVRNETNLIKLAEGNYQSRNTGNAYSGNNFRDPIVGDILREERQRANAAWHARFENLPPRIHSLEIDP